MIATLLLDILSVVFCLKNIFHKKFRFDVYAVLFFLTDLFLLAGIYFYGFHRYLFPLMYILLFVYIFFAGKESMKITLIDFLLSLIATGILQQMFEVIIFVLKLQGKEMWDGKVLAGMGCLLLILVLKNKISLNSFSELLQQKNKGWELAAVFAMLFAGAAVFQMKKFELTEDIYYLQSIYFMCVLFCLLNEWQKSRAETERKLEQIKRNRQYHAAYDELRTLVRERQHDMDNHISAILGMIYTIDDHDELVKTQRAYCGDLQEKHEEIKLFLSVENRLIAGFLYVKIQEAMKYQIKVTNRIMLMEEALKISEYDLIDMTGILFDNAVETLAGGRETVRKIYLEITNEAGSLRILTANTGRHLTTEETAAFFQEGYTSKGEGRGIGLKKLKKMVHGMGGDIIVSGEADGELWYTKFEIMIP